LTFFDKFLQCIYSGYSVSSIYILQGSVATQSRYVEMFNKHVIANCPQSAPVKEF